MEWLDTITNMLGVNPIAFLALTILIVALVAIMRAFGTKLEGKEWWKAALTTAALIFGAAGALLFWKAGLYKLQNVWLVLVAGLFNGTLACVGQQYLKKIPWVGKWLKGVVPLLLVCFLLPGCASWINGTRTGIEAANAALNGYDDVAVEVWKKAPTDPKAKEHLGVSLCASYLIQDSLVDAWAVATMIDEGQRKKTDLGLYLANTITILDSLMNYLDAANVPIPVPLKAASDYLEAMYPGYRPPESEPLATCQAVLAEHIPSAFPWATVISSGSELALFMIQIIRDQIDKKDVSSEALETYLRVPFKQEILYESIEATGGGEGP